MGQHYVPQHYLRGFEVSDQPGIDLDIRQDRKDIKVPSDATNKSLTIQRLWYFAAGRGGQEKTFAELRSQFALDVVPTKSYAANSAWQQLNVLAHNLCRSFQLDTIAETKSISRKRTCTHLLHTIRTIRFRIINKAGRLVRVSGRNALRMATNSTTQTLFEKIELALA